MRDYVRSLRSALGKLPDYHGVVYRSAELNPAAREAYWSLSREGATLTEPGFTSTTGDPSVLLRGNTIFVIDSRHGKDVTALSASPEIHEVIFDVGTRFRALQLREFGDGRIAILLSEVNGGEDEDLAQLKEGGLRLVAAARLLTETFGAARGAAGERFFGPVGLDDEGNTLPAPPTWASDVEAE